MPGDCASLPVVVSVVMALLGLFAAYEWTRDTYYVTTDDQRVQMFIKGWGCLIVFCIGGLIGVSSASTERQRRVIWCSCFTMSSCVKSVIVLFGKPIFVDDEYDGPDLNLGPFFYCFVTSALIFWCACGCVEGNNFDQSDSNRTCK